MDTSFAGDDAVHAGNRNRIKEHRCQGVETYLFVLDLVVPAQIAVFC
jgi:hypothetical protein